MSSSNIRNVSWAMATGVGYSFILTIIMAIISLIVKAFYPPSQIEIAPLRALFVSPAVGIIQLLILALMVAFASPRLAVRRELLDVRSLAIFTGMGYLFFSLLPYAFPQATSQYPQSFVGLVIAYNILNGAFAGVASSYLKL